MIYRVDISGYVLVEAEDREEAERKAMDGDTIINNFGPEDSYPASEEDMIIGFDI